MKTASRERNQQGRPAKAAETRTPSGGSGRRSPKPGAQGPGGPDCFRFDDPYWDDAFDSYHSPTLRVCCPFF